MARDVDDDNYDARSTDSGDSAASLKDFIVDDEDVSGDEEDIESDDDEPITEPVEVATSEDDLSDISTQNVVLGKRTRRPVERYVDPSYGRLMRQHFGSAVNHITENVASDPDDDDTGDYEAETTSSSSGDDDGDASDVDVAPLQ